MQEETGGAYGSNYPRRTNQEGAYRDGDHTVDRRESDLVQGFVGRRRGTSREAVTAENACGFQTIRRASALRGACLGTGSQARHRSEHSATGWHGPAERSLSLGLEKGEAIACHLAHERHDRFQLMPGYIRGS